MKNRKYPNLAVFLIQDLVDSSNFAVINTAELKTIRTIEINALYQISQQNLDEL